VNDNPYCDVLLLLLLLLLLHVQLLLVHAANQTAEEVWATAGTPPPDLLNPHPAGTVAASHDPSPMTPPQPPAAQDGMAVAPVQCAAQEMAASCPAGGGMEALQQQLDQASSTQGSAAAGDKVLAQAATAAAGAAAEALAALQHPQRPTTAQWVPLRISNNTARLLVLVRTLLLKVVLLPAALRVRCQNDGGLVSPLMPSDLVQYLLHSRTSQPQRGVPT
jgi:type IV secretory pathway VirB10-like protein